MELSEARDEPRRTPSQAKSRTLLSGTSNVVSFAEEHESIDLPPLKDQEPQELLENSRGGSSSVRFRRSSSFGKKQAFLAFKSHKFDIETGKANGRECVVTQVLHHHHPMGPRERLQKQFFGSFFRKSQPRGLRPEDSDVGQSVNASSASMRSVGEASVFDEGNESYRQYRIRTNKNEGLTWYQRLLAQADDENYLFSHDPNSHRRLSTVMSRFLNWTFRTSFVVLVTVQFLQWCVLVMIFAVVICGFGLYDPQCIQVGDDIFDKNAFMDCLALSWTTFSTVGYGLIYPQVTSNFEKRCIGLNIFMSLESFIGVVFAAMAGAIIYGKVSRIQSVADVEFSDPLVVRYGSGCVEGPRRQRKLSSSIKSLDGRTDESTEGAVPESSDDGVAATKSDEDEADEEEPLPCPVLEFRILNKAWSRSRGEIINSSIKCVSSILAKDASESIRNAALHGSETREEFVLIRRTPLNAGTTTVSGASMVRDRCTAEVSRSHRSDRSTASEGRGPVTALTWIVDPIRKTTTNYVFNPIKKNVDYWRDMNKADEDDLEDDRPRARSKLSTDPVPLPVLGIVEDAVPRPVEHVLVDEGSSLVPRIIFSTMQLDTSEHPFFRRVWILRHTLNEESPLLTTSAKRLVMENGGHWPESLNSYQAVRNSISFHKIIVSFCGTSNASGSTVYKQKTYSYIDMNIGYSFAKVMHWDRRGKLAVDSHLLNDVVAQRGGGAEPFEIDEIGFRGLVDNIAGKAQQGVTAAVGGVETGATRTTQAIARIIQKMGTTDDEAGVGCVANDPDLLKDDEETGVNVGEDEKDGKQKDE